MKRQAVILAAGRGSRLGSWTDERPKCLTEVGGCTLLEHQIAALSSAGIEEIVIVTGYGEDIIRSRFNGTFRYVRNERYLETNSLYSLWLARDAVEDGFVLLNCDVLADPAIYSLAAQAPGSALTFDSTSGDDEEHMKVQVENGALRDIRKDLPASVTSGENVGVLSFSADGARGLFEACEWLVRHGERRMWAPAAVGRLARSTEVKCIDIAGLPWIEIDFPEDLHEAGERIWPAISRRARRCCAANGDAGGSSMSRLARAQHLHSDGALQDAP